MENAPMFTLNCKGRLLVLETPIVMGIINTTPDSFYAGSRTDTIQTAVRTGGQMLTEGATILDLGGQSTRPGSELLSAQQEAERVIPVIEAITNAYPDAFISIDTFYSEVAGKAVAAGASIVNDISGGNMDQNMLSTVAGLKVPYVCMHMKGTPQTMQQYAQYTNVTNEVTDHFIERSAACKAAGITDLIIDPGFGFAKTIEHNFQLLRSLEALNIFKCPVLVGLSRKSTVWRTLNITPEEALNGTTVLNTVALQKGASILRVHDVRPAIECIRLMEAYKKSPR